MTKTAIVTALQVAESLSVTELRDAAEDIRRAPKEYYGAWAEDFAQLLEYIADLREARNE